MSGQTDGSRGATRGRVRAGHGVALLIGLALAAASAELVLRIHNPIPMPVRGRSIVLPVGKRFVMEMPPGKLDETVHWSMNRLGFRGPDPPEDFAGHVTLVAVGGSTTECRYLSDGRDWPARLAQRLARRLGPVWLNNAGLDGHSTYGHRVLLEQLVLDLSPDYVLLLVGTNDVGREEENYFDASLDPAWLSLRDAIIERSEFLSTLQVLSRSVRAFDLGLRHIWQLDLTRSESAPVSARAVAERVERHRKLFVPGYRARLVGLVELARGRGIEPVLLTQPVLYGEGIDPTTGVALGPLLRTGLTSAEHWHVLEAYNDATRRVAADQGVLLIDLARTLPKDSALFVDWMHYANPGAERVAELVDRELGPYLEYRHPDRVITRRARARPDRPLAR